MPPDPPTMKRTYKSYKALDARPLPQYFMKCPPLLYQSCWSRFWQISHPCIKACHKLLTVVPNFFQPLVDRHIAGLCQQVCFLCVLLKQGWPRYFTLCYKIANKLLQIRSQVVNKLSSHWLIVRTVYCGGLLWQVKVWNKRLLENINFKLHEARSTLRSLVLWKHRVSLLLQSFRSASSMVIMKNEFHY